MSKHKHGLNRVDLLTNQGTLTHKSSKIIDNNKITCKIYQQQYKKYNINRNSERKLFFKSIIKQTFISQETVKYKSRIPCNFKSNRSFKINIQYFLEFDLSSEKLSRY